MDNTPLGYICFWTIKRVDIDRGDFVRILHDLGFDPKYAQTHNYRSTFVRALRALEDRRYIKFVAETDGTFEYQVTKPEMSESKTKGKHVNFKLATKIVVSKDRWKSTKDFKKSVISGDSKVVNDIAELFAVEANKYRAPDVTRYIQKILRENADFLTLRKTGGVYFIPETYAEILEKLDKMFELIGCDTFEYVPVHDSPQSRRMIKRAALSDIGYSISLIEKELEDKPLNSSKQVEFRLGVIQAINDRISFYQDIIKNDAKELKTRLNKVAKVVKEAAA